MSVQDFFVVLVVESMLNFGCGNIVSIAAGW
jgi:hypothetical protein